MVGGVEGGGLLFEVGDELGAVDGGKAGDVVDGFFGVERGALAAQRRERVDDMGADLQHAELEDGKEAYGACADDGDVGFVMGGHDLL